MLLALLAVCLGHVTAYLEVELVRAADGHKVSYGIPVTIKDYDYTIGVALDSLSAESIKPVEGLHHKKQHRKSHDKESKNHQFNNGVLKATSVEGYTAEGWRRFFMEAIFFAEKRYEHELTLELDFLQVKDSASKLNNGSMNLAPVATDNKLYMEIKKNSDLIQNDVFAVYLGARDTDHRIQFGGYEDDYGRFYEGKKFQTVKAADNNQSWLIPTTKILFSKEHSNKWQEFNLLTSPSEVKLSLDSNTVTIKQQIVDKLEMALESQSITCHIEQKLVCSNITSIELSLHMLVFQLAENFFVNISLYRMLDSCDDHQHKCSFHLYVGEEYRLGEQFFHEYYTSFDMNNRTITMALCNKYPETWFSTVYILRFIIGFFLLIVVSAVVAAAPQFYQRYVYWRKKRSGLEGIELVNQQSLAALEE